jgi:hypothetical protein
MADGSIYVWFMAIVWPDHNRVPTASIYHWERDAGQRGRHVATVPYDESHSFRSVMEGLGYEVVEGQFEDSVTARGVYIALRREAVPVPVPVRQRVPA